jgi:hypothetical protein
MANRVESVSVPAWIDVREAVLLIVQSDSDDDAKLASFLAEPYWFLYPVSIAAKFWPEREEGDDESKRARAIEEWSKRAIEKWERARACLLTGLQAAL